jgi:hypothetical protein
VIIRILSAGTGMQKLAFPFKMLFLNLMQYKMNVIEWLP